MLPRAHPRMPHRPPRWYRQPPRRRQHHRQKRPLVGICRPTRPAPIRCNIQPVGTRSQIRNVPNDYPSSFSNENAGYWPRSSPQIGTADNVFLTVGRDPTPGACGAYSDPVRASDTTLGDDPAKRYVIASPPGFGNPDPSYRILIEGVHQNHCWILSFDSRTQRARDTNAADDDRIVASFKFLD